MKLLKYFLSFALCISISIFPSDSIPISFKRSELEHLIRENDDLSAVLMSLKILSDDAKLHGGQMPRDNLCTFKSGRNRIFCQGNKGIPRIEMPQIAGKPKAGSKAEKMVQQGLLKKDPKSGYVDLKDHFVTFMKTKYGVSGPEEVDASTLKSTQNELLGSIVAGMWWSLKQNQPVPLVREPIFVSKDNYIIDGHHRWATMYALQYGALELKPVMMKVIRINKDIETLIKETKEFTADYGIEPESGTSTKK